MKKNYSEFTYRCVLVILNEHYTVTKEPRERECLVAMATSGPLPMVIWESILLHTLSETTKMSHKQKYSFR